MTTLLLIEFTTERHQSSHFLQKNSHRTLLKSHFWHHGQRTLQFLTPTTAKQVYRPASDTIHHSTSQTMSLVIPFITELDEASHFCRHLSQKSTSEIIFHRHRLRTSSDIIYPLPVWITPLLTSFIKQDTSSATSDTNLSGTSSNFKTPDTNDDRLFAS